MAMKRMTLDDASASVKEFVQGLPLESGGVQLELEGRVVCTVVPPGGTLALSAAVVLDQARGLVRRSRDRNLEASEETIQQEVHEAVEQVRRKRR
jgi:hypothetical protein